MESIATLLFWCVGQMVKLSPFHGDDAGSIPARITVLVAQLVKASDCESEDYDFKFHLTPNMGRYAQRRGQGSVKAPQRNTAGSTPALPTMTH